MLMKRKLIKRMDLLRPFAIAFIAMLAALGGSIMQSANGAQIAAAESPKLIAHFTTYYGESSENRKYNVELAAR